MENIIKNRMEKLDIRLNNEKLQQFEKFYELLVKWNEVMNLTAITKYEEVADKHFVDSISIGKAVDMNQIESVIDIGTGAGFPGIPLKIVYPHLKITLLDSLNKRIKFLNEVIDELELESIEAIHGRAEEFAKKKEYREKYDLCVSRAVANLSTLSEYSLPFVKIGGLFVAYKAEKVDEEVEKAGRAVSMLGGEFERMVKFQLPETDIGRTLVKINKIRMTEKRYPRKAGVPVKEPL